jgi:glycosyltransferase involved in cell wall biosynthesis
MTLKLLYVVSLWRQPTETFVRREIAAARQAGHSVLVLSLKPPLLSSPDDPPVVFLDRRAVARHLACTVARRPVRALLALARVLQGTRLETLVAQVWATLYGLAAADAVPKVDWVHAHFAWLPATAADAFATVRRQPFGVMPHAFDVYENRVVDRLLGQKLRRAGVVVVESERIRVDIDARFGCRSRVLRMGVPRAFVRDGPPPPGEPGLVVTVGTLKGKKGHDVLLRALARLDGPWRGVVIGEGPDRAALEALSQELGTADRVTFLGALPEEEVQAWLDKAMASRIDSSGDRDGVPNVLIEAMARARPVVSTAVSGIPDLLEPERGLVVPPEDPEALAAALNQLLTDGTLRDRLAQAARDHVAEAYVAERNWAQLEGHIHRLLTSHPR